tara:strand:- start:1567 stop:1806 length:240 start_codon:yes stop_codon:yes gene_type:complete
MFLFAVGCAATPIKDVPKECQDVCQAALDLRNKSMKKFERLCIALSYVKARHYDDPNIQREVEEGVMVCDYVYGNRNHG